MDMDCLRHRRPMLENNSLYTCSVYFYASILVETKEAPLTRLLKIKKFNSHRPVYDDEMEIHAFDL